MPQPSANNSTKLFMYIVSFSNFSGMWELVSKLALTFYRGWQSWLWGRRGLILTWWTASQGIPSPTVLLKFWELDLYPPRQEIRGFLSWEVSPRQDREWHLWFPQWKTQFSVVLPHFEVPPHPYIPDKHEFR